jgi:hypothetical protein
MRYKFQNYLLKSHEAEVWQWLYLRYDNYAERNTIAQQMEEYPELTIKFVENLRYTDEQNQKRFFKAIKDKSVIGVLLGIRGSGKTATIMWLLEQYHIQFKQEICAYNVSTQSPQWIQQKEFDEEHVYEDLSNNSVTGHDEVHLDIEPKKFTGKGNVGVKRYLSTTRHRKQSIYYLSQLASGIGLDMMKFADILMFKRMNLFNEDTDRKEYLKQFTPFFPKHQDEILIIYGDQVFYFKHKLPKFWTNQISEAFK